MKFRIMSNAYEIPVNDKNGTDDLYLRKFMITNKIDFTTAIDQLIYKDFILSYSRYKYDPFTTYKIVNGSEIYSELFCQ